MRKQSKTAGLTERQRVKVRKLRRKGESSENIAEKTGLDIGTVAAYLANITKKKELRRIKEKLLIIECTSESKEEKSESLLLHELLRILESATQLKIVKIRGRQRFLEELRNAEQLFIHVSAHGEYRKGKRIRGTFLHFLSGTRIHTDDLKHLWVGRHSSKKPMLILFSACEAGHKDMAKTLYEAGCRYYIAPEDDVYWFDAAIFLTVFYRLLLVEGHSPWIAYKKADFGLKQILPYLSGKWCFYDKVSYLPTCVPIYV